MCRKSSVLAVGNVKGEIMYFELKENKPHGTKDDPFSTYHIKMRDDHFRYRFIGMMNWKLYM